MNPRLRPDAQPGGLEVRLLRRLPADAAQLRGRAARRSPGGADRLLPRGDPRRGRGPVRRVPRRGVGHHRGRRGADPGGPPGLAGTLVTIGACATSGGIQALRNFADVAEYRVDRLRAPGVPLDPGHVHRRSPTTSTVDVELRGCPVDKHQLLEVLTALVQDGRARASRPHSVCVECKRRGTVCVAVAHGTPCLGPVTHAGCGALCPAYSRGCYGCFGPQDTANTASLADRLTDLGMPHRRRAAAVPHLQRRGCRSRSVAESARSTTRPPPRRAGVVMTVRHEDGDRRRLSHVLAEPTVRVLARVEGEGAHARAGPRRPGGTTSSCRSSSRRGSSRRSCAAAPAPSRRTSPRASAGSARWPTR